MSEGKSSPNSYFSDQKSIVSFQKTQELKVVSKKFTISKIEVKQEESEKESIGKNYRQEASNELSMQTDKQIEKNYIPPFFEYMNEEKKCFSCHKLDEQYYNTYYLFVLNEHHFLIESEFQGQEKGEKKSENIFDIEENKPD